MKISSMLKGLLVCSAVLSAAGAASSQEMKRFQVGLTSTSFVSAPAQLAKEMGLFKKRGLDIEFVVMESGSAATTALISKSIDLIVGGPGELIAARSRGREIVIIANVYAGLSGTIVLSKEVATKLGVSPTAPVSERTRALGGLTIASPSATSAFTIAARNAAQSGGVTAEFAYMAQNIMPAALERKAIQGFIASAPFWGSTIANGLGVVWLSGPKGEFPTLSAPASTSSFQARRDFADANPELMKRFADVFAEFVQAVDERPADVKAALSVIYRDVSAETLDVLFKAESAAWKAKPLTAKDMAYEVEFMKKSGANLPDIDKVDPATMLFFR